jgi:hypothetical protein
MLIWLRAVEYQGHAAVIVIDGNDLVGVGEFDGDKINGVVLGDNQVLVVVIGETRWCRLRRTS